MTQPEDYDFAGRSLHSLVELISIDEFPLTDFVPADAVQALFDGIYFTEATWWRDGDNDVALVRLALLGEVAIGLPGTDAVRFVLAGGAVGWTSLLAKLTVGPDLSLSLLQVPLSVEVSPEVLRDVGSGAGARFSMTADLMFSPDGVDFANFSGVSLAPAYVCGTGIKVQATNVRPVFGPFDPPTFLVDDPEFRGLALEEVSVVIPGEYLTVDAPADDPNAGSELVIRLENAAIGNTGFTGKVALAADPDAPITGSAFGFPFRFREFTLDIEQNALRDLTLGVDLHLQAFDGQDGEKWVGVDLDFHPGGFSACLSAVQPGQDQPGEPLFTVGYPGVLAIHGRTLRLAEEGGVWSLGVSGDLQLLFDAAKDWPRLGFDDLMIDSTGRLRLGGGWLSLPRQVDVDFYGFRLELSQLGFGQTQDGGKWVGFSGGVRLVDGIPAGASVEGLRVTWYDDGSLPRVTLNGVSVEFEIPDVLRLSGAVAYRSSGTGGRGFAGAVQVQLLALGVEVDGSLVIGSTSDASGPYGFAGAYLALELPAGIPLGSTGLALYGMAGLTAVAMAPTRKDDEDWYDGWYRRDPVGVTDIADGGKWCGQRGSFAFGAGVTIGTGSDNGHLFSGRFLLLIVLPGPIIMLDGKANLLKERAALNAEEPLLRSLAVLDGRAGTLSIGLDARYRYGDKGELVDIRGSSHAFFDFNDPDAWYLDIGRKEPETDRVRATLFRFFEASSYFMLSADGLELGARVEFRPKPWKAGPLKASIEAWIDGSAAISAKPAHFTGETHLHGSASLSAFGHGIGITADAYLGAEVFDPYHIKGSLGAKLNLPWPLPDIKYTFELEWGPERTVPPVPVPLKEIAVEHFKSTASWPLQAGTMLLPSLDRGDGFLADDTTVLPDDAPPPDAPPVVPLDARPHLTFGHTMHDLTGAGFNAAPQPEWDRIGDPDRNEGPLSVRYELTDVAMDKWTGTGWQPVARPSGNGSGAAGVRPLYGSWALVPSQPLGGGDNLANTKLWLWSKTPFEYNRWTSRGMQQWLLSRIPEYPCQLVTPRSWDFSAFATGSYGQEWSPYAAGSGPSFRTDDAEGLAVEDVPGPSGTPVRALRFPFFGYGEIILPEPTTVVRVRAPYLPAEYVGLVGYLAPPLDRDTASWGLLQDDWSTVELRATTGYLGRIGVTVAPLGERVLLIDNLSGVRDCDTDGRYLFAPESEPGVLRCGQLGQFPAHWANPMPGTDPDDPQSAMFTLGGGYQQARQVRYLPSGLLYVLEAGNGGDIVRLPVSDPPVAGEADRSGADVLYTGIPEPRQLLFDRLADGSLDRNAVYLVGTRPEGGYLARLDLSGAGTAPLYLPFELTQPAGLAGGRPWTPPGGQAPLNIHGMYVSQPRPDSPGWCEVARLEPWIDDQGQARYYVRSGNRLRSGPPTLHHDGAEVYFADTDAVYGLYDVELDAITEYPRRLAAPAPGDPPTGATRVGYGRTGAPRLIVWSGSAIHLYDLPPILGPRTGGFNEPWFTPPGENWDLRGYDRAKDRLIVLGRPAAPQALPPIEAVTLPDGDGAPVHETLGTNFPSPGVMLSHGDFLYLTVYSGGWSLVRVDLSNGPVDYQQQPEAVATLVGPVTGTVAPTALDIDASGTALYYLTATGTGTAVARIDLTDATFPGAVVYEEPAVNRLDQLLMDRDGTGAYTVRVPATGAGPHELIEVTLADGHATTVADLSQVPAAHLTGWADDARQRIVLTSQYGVHLMDLAHPAGQHGLLVQAFRSGDRHWPVFRIDETPTAIVRPGGRLLVATAIVNPEFAPGFADAGLRDIITPGGSRQFTLPHVYVESITDVGGAVVLQRFEEVLAQWSQEGPVLEPDTTYRLKVVTRVQARGEGEISGYELDRSFTQYAYFRTEGAPALATLTPPRDNPAGADYRTGLEDLSRYVARTIPESAPAASRWYRGYDVGVEFNENYVDEMYRLDWRGLDIQLYDNDGPARTGAGALLALANRWGRTDDVNVYRTELSWLQMLTGEGRCGLTAPEVLPGSKLSVPAEPVLLAPGTRYEARLVPMLLHDDFSRYPTGTLGRWVTTDLAGTSSWSVISEGVPAAYHLIQASPATSLLLTEPAEPAWTDYRLSGYLRPPAGGAIGLVLRYDSLGHYRYIIDTAGPDHRRIERVAADGSVTVLVHDGTVPATDRDYLVTVEAIGADLRVFTDGEATLRVTDAALGAGRVGLYCAVTGDPAQFSDVRVNDYRPDAPVAYRFAFTTSQFVDFRDHLSSYDGRTDRVELDPDTAPATWFGDAGSPAAPPCEDEARGYAALERAAAGPATGTAVRVTRIARGPDTVALLVRSPEPLDWWRLDIRVSRLAAPDGAFVLVPQARLLRGRDGTGFAVVLPAPGRDGSCLPPGRYRLDCAYRRDRRTDEPRVPLLTRAGDASTEVASIDIPCGMAGAP